MASWGDWLVGLRGTLREIRGDGPTDAVGLPVPALSVMDGIVVLGRITASVIIQLNRLHPPGVGAAVTTDLASPDGVWTGATAGNLGSTLEAADYLAAFPPPPTSDGGGKPWLRSRLNFVQAFADMQAVPGMTANDDLVNQAWADAFAGHPAGPASYVYTVYTPNPYDDASGQLMELHSLVAAFQAACDAVADGALGSTDMSLTMSNDALAALWSALGRITSSLDTLHDVPPRPDTTEVLHDALDAGAQAVGDVLAKAANIAGEAVGNAARGIFEGIGPWGIAAAVGVLAIYFAIH